MKRKELECVRCGQKQPIFRKDSKNKTSGHIKHLWCPRCKKRTAHVELNEFEQQFERNVAAMTADGGK